MTLITDVHGLRVEGGGAVGDSSIGRVGQSTAINSYMESV